MNKTWKVVLAFVGVFVAGVICGEPLREWYRDYRQDHRPRFIERTMQRYHDELELTPAQEEKIRPILLRAQGEWRRIRQENVRNLTGVIDQMHADVAAELTEPQRVKLEEMRKELRARAERLRGRTRGVQSDRERSKS